MPIVHTKEKKVLHLAVHLAASEPAIGVLRFQAVYLNKLKKKTGKYIFEVHSQSCLFTLVIQEKQ